MLRAVSLRRGTSAVRGLVSASSTPKQVLVGPAVRLLLHDYRIDPTTLKPSGPKGNLLKSDVLTHIRQSKLKPNTDKPPLPKLQPSASKSATPASTQKSGPVSQKRRRRHDHEDVPLTGVRAEMAKKLADSKTSAPHFYLSSEINVDKLLETCKYLNGLASKAEGRELSIQDFVVKASVLACQRVPETNSFFMRTHIRKNRTVNVSTGVDELRESQDGGTFTVSNLGQFGSVDHFTATINLPQSCALTIGGTKKRVIPSEEGHRQATTIDVTLSCDHRVVDGAVGARWLKEFKSLLESPNSIFL